MRKRLSPLRRYTGPALGLGLLCSCSLLVRGVPLCGDGTLDEGEVCFSDQRVATGVLPLDLTLADLNGDGLLDALADNFGNAASNGLNAHLNLGDGQLDAPLFSLVGDFPAGLSTGDYNGDGALDAAVTTTGLPDAQGVFPPGKLNLLFGDGSGRFTLVQSVEIGIRPQLVTSGDLDGDGDLDLVISNQISLELSLLFNNGGFFAELLDPVLGTPLRLPTNSAPLGVALADLDVDGDLDIVSTDFALDAALQTAGSTIKIFLNDGLGAFPAPPQEQPVGGAPFIVAPGDLDGDDDPDLVVTNFLTDNANVLLNQGPSNGGIGFLVSAPLPAGNGPEGASLGDLDQDGDLDLAVAALLSEEVRVFLNNGQGGLALLSSAPVGVSPQIVAAGDLNADGLADLVVANSGADDLSLLLSTP